MQRHSIEKNNCSVGKRSVQIKMQLTAFVWSAPVFIRNSSMSKYLLGARRKCGLLADGKLFCSEPTALTHAGFYATVCGFLLALGKFATLIHCSFICTERLAQCAQCNHNCLSAHTKQNNSISVQSEKNEHKEKCIDKWRVIAAFWCILQWI